MGKETSHDGETEESRLYIRIMEITKKKRQRQKVQKRIQDRTSDSR